MELKDYKLEILNTLEEAVADKYDKGIYGSNLLVTDMLAIIQNDYIIKILDIMYEAIIFHSTYNCDVLEKVMKIKALINSGVGGEKVAAEIALNKLLCKHNDLGLQDIEFFDQEKEDRVSEIVKQCIPLNIDVSTLSKNQLEIIAWSALCGINESLKECIKGGSLKVHYDENCGLLTGMFTSCQNTLNYKIWRHDIIEILEYPNDNVKSEIEGLSNDVFWVAASNTFHMVSEICEVRSTPIKQSVFKRVKNYIFG